MAAYGRHIVGKLGEDIVCRYLEGKGYRIIERNYRKKWGEIDIIAEKAGAIYFVEVKTVARKTIDFSHETATIRPEENLHPQKLKRLSRIIQTYLAAREPPTVHRGWQLDAVIVFLDRETRQARIRRIPNIVL